MNEDLGTKLKEVREKLHERYEMSRKSVMAAQNKINEGEAVGQEPSRHAAEEKARCQGMQSAAKQSLAIFDEAFSVPPASESKDGASA